MNAATKQHGWNEFVKFYSRQNEGRTARIGVFENQSDVFNDYWLGAGLMFIGIDADIHDGMPAIEIMFEDFTHTVKGARKLNIHLSLEGDEDGIDISDIEGKTTILRFENKAADQ